MNKKQLVFLIVIGVLLFVLGGALGVAYDMNKTPQQIKVKTVNSLSSKVVSSIVAYGRISHIDGRIITLNNFGEDLVVSIPDNAKIYSFTIPSGTKTPVQQAATFGSVQLNQNVNVNLKLLPSGQFEGSSIIILPQSALYNEEASRS
jgi:hypothetical protein